MAVLTPNPVVTWVGGEAGLGDHVTEQPTGSSQARDERKSMSLCGLQTKTPFLPKDISLQRRGNRQFKQELERARLAELWAFFLLLKNFLHLPQLRKMSLFL